MGKARINNGGITAKIISLHILKINGADKNLSFRNLSLLMDIDVNIVHIQIFAL